VPAAAAADRLARHALRLGTCGVAPKFSIISVRETCKLLALLQLVRCLRKPAATQSSSSNGLQHKS
jgi:hypothetical protein